MIKQVKGVVRHMQTGQAYDYAEQVQVNYLETTTELTERPSVGAYQAAIGRSVGAAHAGLSEFHSDHEWFEGAV